MQSATWKGPSWLLVSLSALVQLVASLISVSVDCDEIFNYWEPLHFLFFSYGFQTWEYSPLFALRPYLYLLLHRLPVALLVNRVSKPVLFRIIKLLLTVFSLYCQHRLCLAVGPRFGARTAHIACILFAMAPGMLQANGSLLPNSLAMCLGMLLWANYWEGADLRVALLAMAIGIVAWPYALISAIIPLGTSTLTHVMAKNKEKVKVVMEKISWLRWTEILIRRWTVVVPFGVIYILLPTVLLDRFYYGRWTVTPWNAIVYNLFSPPGAGPSAFGSEPAYFLFKNLLLNFNLLILAALSAVGFDLGQDGRKLWATCWLTIGIFSFMAHKEERFLYHVYPLLILLAAAVVGKLRKGLAVVIIVACTLFGWSRFMAQVHNHQGSIQILHVFGSEGKGVLCMADSWHLFPSHFHLPPAMRVAFLQNNFQGILPQYFDSTDSTKTLFNGYNRPLDHQFLQNTSHCSFFYGSQSELDVLGLGDDSSPLQCAKVALPGGDAGWLSSSRRWLYIPLFPPNASKLCVFAINRRDGPHDYSQTAQSAPI